MIPQTIEIKFKTNQGKLVAFEKVDGESFKMTFDKNKLMINEEDVFHFVNVLRLVVDEFDSKHFQKLQWTHPEILQEKLKELSDDQLLLLAKFDEKNKNHQSTTNMIRTELFVRNGIKKAGYKLNLNQKSFLFSVGLSMK